jgi:hypothetical protein
MPCGWPNRTCWPLSRNSPWPAGSQARRKNEKAIADAETALTAAAKARDAAAEVVAQPNENYRFGTVYPATSTGRRLAARWIADRNNPDARVAVNHLDAAFRGSAGADRV